MKNKIYYIMIMVMFCSIFIFTYSYAFDLKPDPIPERIFSDELKPEFEKRNISKELLKTYKSVKKPKNFENMYKLMAYLPEWKIPIYEIWPNTSASKWKYYILDNGYIDSDIIFDNLPIKITQKYRRNFFIEAKIKASIEDSNSYLLESLNILHGNTEAISLIPDEVFENINDDLSFNESCYMIVKLISTENVETLDGGVKSIGILLVNAIMPKKSYNLDNYVEYILANPDVYPPWYYCQIIEDEED